MKCMRCHRETKHPVAGLGPVCARKTAAELGLRKRRKVAPEVLSADPRQVDWVAEVR